VVYKEGGSRESDRQSSIDEGHRVIEEFLNYVQMS
jgi:hypothetical protein